MILVQSRLGKEDKSVFDLQLSLVISQALMELKQGFRYMSQFSSTNPRKAKNLDNQLLKSLYKK